MSFRSILNSSSESGPRAEIVEAPACFADLNLDQVVAAITAGKEEYNLRPFFYEPLTSREAIEYRQDVMRDLEDHALFAAAIAFANNIRSVRERLAQAATLHYRRQKEIWLLDAIDLYCHAVEESHSQFRSSTSISDGLSGYIDFLAAYLVSEDFQRLVGGVNTLKERLASVRYTLVISNGVITVSTYDDEPDYGAEIQADFEKFRQGGVKDHIFKFSDFAQMNHIEAGVLDRVARLYPEVFAELDAFTVRNSDFFDPTIERFDREIQFYVSYIAHMRHVSRAGVTFCYPKLSAERKEIGVTGGCDIALAKLLTDKNLKIVPNDFFLDGRERIIVVSGPNQGGKTTFARMFGQLHYLASIGCPIPGTDAQLFLFDQLFTHFEKEEDIHNLRGKLHDDLYRLHNTLNQATSSSIIVLNEVFNSTSLKDAIFLSTKILRKIIELDSICVCVTFIDELATLSKTTVSMASTVKPGDVAERTFKIVRRPPDGLAYAISVAEKYGLTYTRLRERLAA